MSEVSGESFALIEPVLARQGVHLDARQRDGVVRFAELIVHWNRGINLVGNVERLYSRHLLDCLMLATLPWPAGAVEIADVGAGAGLPGIVVALLHPECRVHGLETVAKKVTFQQVAASALELDNYLPRREDAHALARSPDGRGRYDVVLARAFAGLESLLDLSAQLLRPGGELWAMKGRKLEAEQAALPPRALARFEPEHGEFRYDVPELGTGGVTAVYRRLPE